MRLSGSLAGLAGLAALAPGGAALAQSVEPGESGSKVAAAFNDASPEVQLVVVGLILCSAAAMGLGPWLASRLRRRPDHEPVGTGFISGLRLGAPLAAAVVIARNLLNWQVGMVWLDETPTPLQLAQGWAELALIAFTGLLASAAAVFAHAHIEAVRRRVNARAFAGPVSV